MTARITRIGNTLTVEIPETLAAQASLAAGDRVEWVASGAGISLVKQQEDATKSPSLEDLLRELPENAPIPEEDWGAPRGVEAW